MYVITRITLSVFLQGSANSFGHSDSDSSWRKSLDSFCWRYPLSHKSDWYSLTLEELSRLADVSPGETGEDCARQTVDWARTLLTQISLIAGLAGIWLPQPYLTGGLMLMWDYETGRVRVNLCRDPCDGAQDSGDKQPKPPSDSNFAVAGDISSPGHFSSDERIVFASFNLSGRFTPEFISSILMDWFSMPPREGATEALQRFGEPVTPWKYDLAPEEELGVWFSPDETRDIHQVVRETFIRLETQGHRIEFAGLTPEQMCRLRPDWDGRGAQPPTPETIEWVQTVLENLSRAADALGIGIREPLTQVSSVVTEEDGPPTVFTSIRCRLWSNLLDIDFKSDPSEHQVSMSFYFDVHSSEESSRGWFDGEFTFYGKKGRPMAEVLWERQGYTAETANGEEPES